MSVHESHHALPPGRERATLLTLGAVQFTHVLDYMIMMPLGAQLMDVFRITPSQFTHLVAAYGLAAAISGFVGGFVLDRFDRKRSLLVLYFGFGLSTFACGLAPTHHWLLAARLAAGAFGGLAGSMVNAMVGDVVPAARRGSALSLVSMSFAVASVLGVPMGLLLADKFGWHAPFFMLAGCAVANLVLASLALPHIKTAVHDHAPWRQMSEIVSHRVHLRAFAVGAVLVMAGGCLVPFIAPSMIANVGLTQVQLAWAYGAGGLCTIISMPIVGRLSDRVDKLKLLAWMSAAAVLVVLVLTRLGPSPVSTACVVMALFMVTMSSRFTPAMTMVTNAVAARYRGGFMSVNAALQQAASGLGNVIAGVFVTQDAAGRLVGYPLLGWAAIGFFILTVLLAAELRAAAPHVSAPATASHPAAAPVEAVA